MGLANSYLKLAKDGCTNLFSLITPNTEILQGKSLSFKALCLVRWKQIVKTHFGEVRNEDENRARLVPTGVQYAITFHALLRTNVS
jgi:hypothetical protein